MGAHKINVLMASLEAMLRIDVIPSKPGAAQPGEGFLRAGPEFYASVKWTTVSSFSSPANHQAHPTES